MNLQVTPAKPRRHVWRWVFLGLGLCLAPIVVLAVVALSYVTLDRDAARLRNNVMAATDAAWSTKVQLDIGRTTIGAIRAGLGFVHGRERELADACLALKAVRHASVGVYECASRPGDWSREQLFATTDAAMQQRGWMRLVGVADHGDSVLIYIPKDLDEAGSIDVCLAVVNAKELVVVSTGVDASALAELAQIHGVGDLKGHLRLAKFRR